MDRKCLISLLLALSLCFAAGCGGDPSIEPSAAGSDAASVPAPVSSAIAAPSDTAVSVEPTEEPPEESAVPTDDPASSDPAQSAADPSAAPVSSTPASSPAPGDDVPLEEGVNAVITCRNGTASVNGTGVSVAGNTIKVTQPGEYRFTGTWNGRITVDVPETEDVKLALYGFTATCSNNSVIEVLSADDVTIKAQNGTQNFIRDTDSSAEKATDTRGKAAIYARSSLEFLGAGSLTVSSDYKHGISATKKLIISNSTLTISAADCGIKGNNVVAVTGGTLTIRANGDGIKTENTTNDEKGSVSLQGGTILIETTGDGVNASRSFDMSNASVTIRTSGTDTGASGTTGRPTSGPGSKNMQNVTDGTSSKGIKAGNEEVGTGGKITITSGTLTIKSTGHAIHSAGTCNIQGTPRVTIETDKKGIQTHGDLTVRGGTIKVDRSVEGLESKSNLKILGGTVTVIATDNGINVASDKKTLTVSGGTVDVTVTGPDADAVDSNGSFLLQGGVVIARSKGKSAVNVGKTMTLSGGTLAAFGAVIGTPSVTGSCRAATFPDRAWDKGDYRLLCADKEIASFSLGDSLRGGYICSDKLTAGASCRLAKNGTDVVTWTQSDVNVTVR